MVAIVLESVSTSPSWQAVFNAMLPDLLRHARYALRSLAENKLDEAIQDVLANCCVALSRLVARGKPEQAFPSVLVRFAVSQYFGGRRVGNRLSVGDVLSPHAQFQRRFQLESLERIYAVSGEWQEALFEDRKTCVADQAAFRIDFPAWLALLSPRDRLIAEALSMSYTTHEVAERFGVSQGRVSQMRTEFRRSWTEFHGEIRDA